MSLSLAQRQAALVAEFSIIEDPQERLAAIVDRARSRNLPADARTPTTRVSGCQTPVWVVATSDTASGRVRITFDADSPLVKGLVALLCDIADDSAPEELAVADFTVVTGLRLERLISPTRLRGLAAVADRLRQLGAEAAGLSTKAPPANH